MLEARITGSAELRRLATSIRATGDKGLGREMSAGLRRASEPVKVSIRDSAEDTMPERGGYKAQLSRSLRFRTQLHAGVRTASFRLFTYADGTNERRDIRRLELGELRHPVFGRSRRIRVGVRAGTAQPNPWTVTKITPGFHRRGTEKAADAAEREMATVLDEFAQRLAKG